MQFVNAHFKRTSYYVDGSEPGSDLPHPKITTKHLSCSLGLWQAASYFAKAFNGSPASSQLRTSEVKAFFARYLDSLVKIPTFISYLGSECATC